MKIKYSVNLMLENGIKMSVNGDFEIPHGIIEGLGGKERKDCIQAWVDDEVKDIMNVAWEEVK